MRAAHLGAMLLAVVASLVDLVTPGGPGCDFEVCVAEAPGGRWQAVNAPS